MWTVVLQGTAMRLSDLLLTTLLLDWPSLGEMKPQPRQAVDPRSEIGASEQQLQYLCLVVGISKMNVSSRAHRTSCSKWSGLCQRWREDVHGRWLSRYSFKNHPSAFCLSMRHGRPCFSSYIYDKVSFSTRKGKRRIFLVPSLYSWIRSKSHSIADVSDMLPPNVWGF